MNSDKLVRRLEEALGAIPVIDIHTHLVGGKLGARGLHDVLLYHMVVSDLYAAGCPSGGRLTQFPAWPTEKEAQARLEEAIPFLPHIQNTSSFWGVRFVLADLYQWTLPITMENCAYINELFLTEIEQRADKIVFQFSLGAEPLPFETASRLSQQTIAQVAGMIACHPKLRFQCFLSSRHANQSLCALARELPNFSLAGYWWHNFFPDVIRQVMAERLDMLPANKQIGFFSDAYCVEWTYAKAMLVRKQMAHVFAAKIEQGQYSFEEALDFARISLFETPQSILRMIPRQK